MQERGLGSLASTYLPTYILAPVSAGLAINDTTMLRTLLESNAGGIWLDIWKLGVD